MTHDLEIAKLRTASPASGTVELIRRCHWAAERLAAAPTPSELATLAAIRDGTWKAVPVDLLRQVYGMANRGSDSPPAAYLWCERINEVMHAGPRPEFAEYAEDVPPPRGEGDA